MKEILLSVLRDKDTTTAAFRRASDQLAPLLCAEAISKLAVGRVEVQTFVGATTGVPLPEDIMVVPIIRAGLALLPAFIQMMPDAPVGLIGIERDEATALPSIYYRKFPKPLPNKAVILDPMLATGGSAGLAVEMLTSQGLDPKAIHFVGVIAARDGYRHLSRMIPYRNITVAVIDPSLNDRKFIVPGLGDYGDRYFGT